MYICMYIYTVCTCMHVCIYICICSRTGITSLYIHIYVAIRSYVCTVCMYGLLSGVHGMGSVGGVGPGFPDRRPVVRFLHPETTGCQRPC